MSVTGIDRRSNASGFTLIEVLVTIVVVSFGLIGLAGLLFSAISAGQTSMQRSVAVAMANEMGDRIRANWMAVKAGAYDNVALTLYDGAGGCATTCMTSVCSPADQAALDICIWKAQLQKQLPNGKGSITGDPSNLMCSVPSQACLFTVVVQWNAMDYDTTGTNASKVFSANTASYTVRVQP